MKTLQERLHEVFPPPHAWGLKADIARVCGVSRPSVTAWFSDPIKVSSISRSHAEALCARFGLKVSPAWLAEGIGQKESANVNASASEFSSSQSIAQDVTTYARAPIVEWAELGVVLNRDNDDWPAADLHVVVTRNKVSRKVKWLEVRDDLLSPRLVVGDMVAIDPEGSPKMDGVVLVKAADGSFMLRFWRPLAGGAFEVFDSAGRVMDSIRHGIELSGTFACLQRDSA